MVSLLLTLVLGLGAGQQRGKPPSAPAPFKNILTAEQMTNKQAVVNTTLGTFVIDLKPEVAPTHVAYFMKLAAEGAYNGTTFHRVVRHGIIQGGDPLSKDPATAASYGTGGLGVLKAEISAEKATRGTVAAVIQPGKPDSAGAQFFVCVTDQPSLEGKYTIFGRVSEGLDVVTKISEAEATAEGKVVPRIAIVSVTIRDTPPPEVEPFSKESVEQLEGHRAVLETSAGPITIEFMPEKAPEHVRNFLRLAQVGVYDGMSFHRVVRGFAIQTGDPQTRGPLTEKQQKYVRAVKAELNDTPHVKGIVSMAHGGDPNTAMSSFFIVTGAAPSLDGKYTVFGRVIDGMAAVGAIDQAPVNGETPVTRIELKTVRVVGPSK